MPPTTSHTLIDPSNLPTHLAGVVARVNQVGPSSSADTFLETSYVVESLIKTICIVLYASIRQLSSTIAYRFGYQLVRADGLGSWEEIVGACTTQAYAGYIDAEMRPLLEWLSKNRGGAEDEWARIAFANCNAILSSLGVADNHEPTKLKVTHIINKLVCIRNKTKAHGAVREAFYHETNTPYLSVVGHLLRTCPVLGRV